MSAWTVKLIRKAYTSAKDDDIRPYKTYTHEVRAIAASLALQENFSLPYVLGTATWANPTTFTEHYLRDVSGLPRAEQIALHRVMCSDRSYSTLKVYRTRQHRLPSRTSHLNFIDKLNL